MAKAIITRKTLEVDLYRNRFKENESIFVFAERIVKENGIDNFTIESIDCQINIIDVSTYDQHRTASGGEIMEIEIRELNG